MCKFHKDVAIAVATDPVSGDFNPTRYSLTLSALARFWVNKYMPTMEHLDGSSNYELCTTEARQAFATSELPQSLRAANERLFERLDRIRAMIDDYITTHHLDAASLHVPKDPYKSPRFLDKATGAIYAGNPAYPLNIKSWVKNAKHEPLRAAMEGLYQQEGFLEGIEGLLKSSISNLFIAAPREVNQKRLSIYDRLPLGLRTAFGSCSLHAGGGALAHVAVCGGLNLAIGGFSGAFMNAAMYAVAPVVAVATTYGVEKYKMNDFNPYKYALPVVLSLAAAFAVSKILPHEHSTDPRMAWFYSLNADGRYNQLQKDHQRYLELPADLQQQVDIEAKRQKMTVAMFMTSLDVCGGELTPKITAFETQKWKKQEGMERALN